MYLYIINPHAPMELSQALLVAVTGIAVVLSELALLCVFILLLSKVMKIFTERKSAGKPELSGRPPLPEAPAPAPGDIAGGTPLPETVSQGSLDLVDVDEATAAVIMAIVSDSSGIPLNRLKFNSIRLLDTEEK